MATGPVTINVSTFAPSSRLARECWDDATPHVRALLGAARLRRLYIELAEMVSEGKELPIRSRWHIYVSPGEHIIIVDSDGWVQWSRTDTNTPLDIDGRRPQSHYRMHLDAKTWPEVLRGLDGTTRIT